jgi:hypothetical protein
MQNNKQAKIREKVQAHFTQVTGALRIAGESNSCSFSTVE